MVVFMGSVIVGATGWAGEKARSRLLEGFWRDLMKSRRGFRRKRVLKNKGNFFRKDFKDILRDYFKDVKRKKHHTTHP